MLHFWADIIKTTCPYTNDVKNKTKMFIFNLFSSAFLIFNFLRFLPCILLQRLFYYGSEPIEWFILLNYCVNPFDFSLETYLDLVLTQKNRTKLSFIQCTVGGLGVGPRTFITRSLAMSWEAKARFLGLSWETVSRTSSGKFLRVESCYPESFGFLCLWHPESERRVEKLGATLARHTVLEEGEGRSEFAS